MSLRVWREKVLLVLSLRALDEVTLARRIYEQQLEHEWPGLVDETNTICQELEIQNCNTSNMNRKDYKELVTEACHRQNEIILRKQAQGRGKCDRIENESYGKKSYIENTSIFDTRQMYKTRFKMQPFAANYSNDARFRKTNFLCRCLLEKEGEGHLMSGKCPVYKDIRDKYDNLEDLEDLVAFFKEVLERRDTLDEDN